MLSAAVGLNLLVAGTAWAAAEATSPRDDRWLGLPRRQPAIAVSLSLACNGLGQYYNGDSEKGTVMLASWLAFPVAYALDTLMGSGYLRLFAVGTNLGIKVWSVSDALQGATLPSPPARTP